MLRRLRLSVQNPILRFRAENFRSTNALRYPVVGAFVVVVIAIVISLLFSKRTESRGVRQNLVITKSTTARI